MNDLTTSKHRTMQLLIVASVVAGVFYVSWLLEPGRADYIWIFVPFIVAELFNIGQTMGYWATVWRRTKREGMPSDAKFTEASVDVFITVYNEPVEVVEPTIRGALAVEHINKKIYLLDDGMSQEMEQMASRLGAGYITRDNNAGAKAGNINNALGQTDGEFVVVFDADHVPVPEFLKKTLYKFDYQAVGIVQTPQYYRNADSNAIAAAANEQQMLFYGPILRGKESYRSVFSCGTNVIYRRSALDSVDGISTASITEDMETTLDMTQKGWEAVYVPEILARGLGPEDLGAYASQQMRWARGGLDTVVRRGLLARGLSIGQRFQYFLAFGYWFTGPAYTLYLIALTVGLFSGLKPFNEVIEYPIHFLPYFLLTLLTLNVSAQSSYTFRAVWLTLSTFPVHIAAIISLITGRKMGFVVTPKVAREESFLGMAIPHIFWFTLLSLGVLFSILIVQTPASISNSAFAIGHLIILGAFIRLAAGKGVVLKPETVQKSITELEVVEVASGGIEQ